MAENMPASAASTTGVLVRPTPNNPIRCRNQLTAAPIGDPVHALGPGGHLEVENTLILGNKTAGPLQQNPQLPVGVGRADMRQNRALTTMLTHHLHRHRTRGRAHLPHTRHQLFLPGVRERIRERQHPPRQPVIPSRSMGLLLRRYDAATCYVLP